MGYPANGASLASVLGELQHADGVELVLLGVVECHVSGLIARSIVDYDDFVGELRVLGAPLLQVSQRLVQHRWHALLFVVGGHNEREVHGRLGRGRGEGLLVIRARVDVHILILVPQHAPLRKVAIEQRDPSHDLRVEQEMN